MLKRVAAILLLACIFSAHAKLDGFSDQEADSAIKAALEKGALVAVALLGKTDGYFGNAAVKIALPEALKKYETPMHGAGLGNYADDLVLAINRAAEAALPEAKKLVVDGVKKMELMDSKIVLASGPAAGTEYFKRSAGDPLRKKLLPIVKKAAARVKLAEKFDAFAQKGVQFGLERKERVNLEDYVTQKALDGLFVVMAEEERRMRRDPAKSGSDIIIKVFGALKT